MPNKIQLKRGNSVNIASLSLSLGEPAFAMDTGKFYIGNSSSKTLINPIDKPSGLLTSNYYSKVKINDYGQVVAQSTLTALDIPTISNTQVSGLGTLSTVNAGTASGQVPLLDSGGKFPVSAIPGMVNYITVYFSGVSSANVAVNGSVPFNNNYSYGSAYTLDANGSIIINQTGVYLMSYHVSSSTAQMTTALAYDGGMFLGSICSSSYGTGLSPLTSTSGLLVRQVATIPEKVSVRNGGTTPFTVLPGQASFVMVKLG